MVRLALLGVGKWGSKFSATAQAIGVEIAFELNSRSDRSKMPEVDGIILATPIPTHYSLAKEFLKQGKNLLIEKPLALNSAQARELHAIWKEQGQPIVLVGHLQLYNPAYRAAKQLISKLGKLKSVSFKGLMSPALDDVSVLWDWGAHPASLFLDLLGPLTDISASGDRRRVTFSGISASGVRAEAEIGWESDQKVRLLTIEGEKRLLTVDDTKAKDKVALTVEGKATFPPYDQTPPLHVELKEFADAISGKAKMTSDIEVGVRVVDLLSKIEQVLR